MVNTWFRKRLLMTLIMSILVSVIVSQLFVYPYIEQRALNYNAQSLYRNTGIDFVAPEPSFEQIRELPGTNGIDTVFPFYLTKAPI